MGNKTLNKRYLLEIFCVLLLMYIYMYVNTSYELSFGSNYGYYQIWRLDYISVIFRYTALLLLFFVSYNFYHESAITKKSKWFVLYFFLVLMIVFWFLESLFSSSFQGMVYSVTSPLVYLTAIAVFIGFSEYGFDYFAKLCTPFSYILIGLSAIYYFLFFVQHPLGLLADSAALTFYTNGFWLFAIGMVYNESHHNKKIRLLSWIFLFVLVMLAFLFNSRGWIIQSILLVLLNVYMQSNGNKLKAVVRICVVVLIIAIMVAYIMINYYPVAWEHMIVKLSKDTRTSQYSNFFSQVSVVDLIFGRGYHFTYSDGLKTGYAYIDNSFLFVLVRYGIVTFISYYSFFMYPIKALFKSKVDKTTQYYAFLVIMWLAALAGLSIFCVISIDFKSIAMSVLAGKCISDISHIPKAGANHAYQITPERNSR